MKILILQPFISYGGAEAVSLQLADELKKKGYKVLVIALYAERIPHLKNEVDLVLPGKIIANFFKKNKLATILFGFPVFCFLVYNNSAKGDVINPHNFPTLWVAGLITFFKKVSVFWTVHNFPQLSATNKLITKITIFLDKFFIKRCKAVIAVSEKVQSQI